MKILAKTKIIIGNGFEIYFRKIIVDDQQRWEPMRKDTSSICGNKDTKFKAQGYVITCDPSKYREIQDYARRIPANFDSDLLSPYAPIEYAEGNKPLPSFRF